MATRQLVIDVPDEVLQAAKVDEPGFVRELKMLAAVKLYELGRLSSDQASKLAGLPRQDFLLSLVQYSVSPIEAELGASGSDEQR